MFDGLLKSKFYTKGKSDIKLIRTRIEIIQKKRYATQKYLRNDVADLLRNGLDVQAFDRVEGLLTEMIRSQCYQLIDQYCEHISKNLSAMNKQRECPEECREAASALMFAAARFADLPELRELRTMFSERYGNSLDFHVNKQFAEKLKSDLPSKDMKLQLLQEIAAESGLERKLKALENKLVKESAPDKKLVKEGNDVKNGSTQKGSTGREIGYERKKDLPYYERREITANEDRIHKKRDVISPPNKIKDIEVDKVKKTAKANEANAARIVHKIEEPINHIMIPPPYTKPDIKKAGDAALGSNLAKPNETKAPKKEEPLNHVAFLPPYTKPDLDKVKRGSTDESKDKAVDAKSAVKSVRTRNHKPPPSDEKVNIENVVQSRKVLRFLDGDRDKRDEEEKIMDRLLRHYSKKNGSSKNGKAEHATKVSSKANSQDGPVRSSSLRVDPTSPKETPKKHLRAASFHPDGNANHVHPKLPDYDEFVARLAAFRGK